MAVRDFTDAKGRSWRAWDIKPETIHPVTRAEDYLADYLTGWIVFETEAGDEKRRLCPWPADWTERSEEQLRELLEMAELVPLYRPGASSSDGQQTSESLLRSREANVLRTFRYPGGRFWSVCLVLFPDEGGPPVLRFSAGARFIDLKSWPKDWATMSDSALVDVLRRAAPRSPSETSADPGKPRRRWDDNRDAATTI
jgi:hypothetical protein